MIKTTEELKKQLKDSLTKDFLIEKIQEFANKLKYGDNIISDTNQVDISAISAEINKLYAEKYGNTIASNTNILPDSKISEYGKLNVGAIAFLNSLNKDGNAEYSAHIIPKLRRCENLRGGSIYKLWHYFACENYDTMRDLCKYCSDTTLERACDVDSNFSRSELIEEMKSNEHG